MRDGLAVVPLSLMTLFLQLENKNETTHFYSLSLIIFSPLVHWPLPSANIFSLDATLKPPSFEMYSGILRALWNPKFLARKHYSVISFSTKPELLTKASTAVILLFFILGLHSLDDSIANSDIPLASKLCETKSLQDDSNKKTMVLSVIPEDGHPYLEIQWKVGDTEVEAVILSNLIEFRGHKAIRLGIQNLKDQRCTLNLFAHHIRHTGIEMKAVICRVDGFEWIDMIQHGCQSTALFTAILATTLHGPQTLTFRVFVANTVCNYRFLLRDCKLKHQLWSAASKNSGTTDMDFKIQNRIFPAHKSLVIARSKIFAAQLKKLEELMDEGSTYRRPRITLDLNPDTFEALLKYMYTGEFQVPVENAEEFWKSVATYGLATLSQLGEVLLQGSLKQTDWIELLGSLAVTQREQQLPTDLSSEVSTISHSGFTLRFPDRILNEVKGNFQFLEETRFGWRYSTSTDEDDKASNLHICFFSSLNCNSDLYVCDVIFRSQNDVITMVERHRQNADCMVQIFYANLIRRNDCNESVCFEVFIRSSIETVGVELVDAQLGESLWMAAEKAEGTDLEFQVGDKVFCAHTWLVASRSQPLATLFSDLLLEEAAGCDIRSSSETELKTAAVITSTAKTTVKINDIEPDVFRELLKYMYTGTLGMAVSKPLLKAAEKFEIESLMNVCRAAIREINYENLSFKLLSY
ncbi:hypothetical protein GHT06_022439 [Daphnia sinensis]|uniref:BTB domain-containing protein n=1 Tax=Daphnia sinensis TaxID=1820382 RepID=A0AAD5KH25_9CRUS|nr:hypothetical protein GHT06_022439 [Daphnia sinensis]